jgi:hypothetical protein
LAKFADDETIQCAFTLYPLTQLGLDYEAKPEPEVFIRYLARDQVQFPIFPSTKEQAASSLEVKLDHLLKNDAMVTVFQPDTGYRIIYLFRKNGCWRLRRIENWSM